MLCQFALAGVGQKDLEQRYQGSSCSKQARPEAFSGDEGLLKDDKLVLKMVFELGGWRGGGGMQDGETEKGEAE